MNQYELLKQAVMQKIAGKEKAMEYASKAYKHGKELAGKAHKKGKDLWTKHMTSAPERAKAKKAKSHVRAQKELIDFKKGEGATKHGLKRDQHVLRERGKSYAQKMKAVSEKDKKVLRRKIAGGVAATGLTAGTIGYNLKD